MRRTTATTERESELDAPASAPVTSPAAAPVSPAATAPVIERREDTYNAVLRGLGVLASCVPLVIGLIAVAKIDWSANGFDSPAVRVAGMTFTPWIAVGTAAVALVAVLAAASAFRGPKLVMGALAACSGLVVMIDQPTVDHVTVVYRYGVMAFVVGLVLIATGLMLRRSVVTTRVPVGGTTVA